MIYATKVNGVKTKEYKLWAAMKQRCRLNTGNYKGCYIHESFLDFQSFARWCNEQVGFSLPNYQLDKDILVPGNKVYGPNTCVFVPKDLNCFNRVNEGEYSQGVSWHQGTQKFRARVQDIYTGARLCLGLYTSELAAFNAYCVAKDEQAAKWCQRIRDEFIVDSRVIEAMDSWNLNERIGVCM